MSSLSLPSFNIPTITTIYNAKVNSAIKQAKTSNAPAGTVISLLYTLGVTLVFFSIVFVSLPDNQVSTISVVAERRAFVGSKPSVFSKAEWDPPDNFSMDIKTGSLIITGLSLFVVQLLI